MNKEQFLKDKFSEFCKKFKVEEPLLCRDDKIGCNYGACVIKAKHTTKKEKRWLVKYNMTVIKRMKQWEIVHLVLHELGHIKKTGKNEIQSEYLAYKFALEILKKHYLKIYIKVFKYLIWYVGDDTNNHGKGFLLLVEELLGL